MRWQFHRRLSRSSLLSSTFRYGDCPIRCRPSGREERRPRQQSTAGRDEGKTFSSGWRSGCNGNVLRPSGRAHRRHKQHETDLRPKRKHQRVPHDETPVRPYGGQASHCRGKGAQRRLRRKPADRSLCAFTNERPRRFTAHRGPGSATKVSSGLPNWQCRTVNAGHRRGLGRLPCRGTAKHRV